MTTRTDPMSNTGTNTPSASYVLQRRYGRARHVILAATWLTVINMLVGPIAASAATYTWDHDGATTGSKDWSSAASWNPNGVPTFVAGDTLDLSTVNITGGATCLMNPPTGSITLGAITIGDATTSSSAWALSRSGTIPVLILDNGGSAAAINQTATSFGDMIAVPLSLLSNLAIDNLSANTLTLGGGISAGSAGLKTITINNTGTGPVTLSTVAVSDGSGQVALAHKAGTLTLSFANSFTGGTTLSAGTIIIGASSSPTVGPLIAAATGPLGKGTLTINGASTFRTDGTTRTIANDFAISSGTVTFGASSGAAALTISGQNQSIAGTPTLSFNTVGTTFASYPMALNSSATLSNTGASGAPSFSGGLTVASGGSTITDSMSTALTIAGPLTLNGSLTLTGTHTGVITMSGITETIVGSGGATLHFNDSAAGNGLTTYTTGPLILGGNFTLTGNSNKKPTVTINGLRIANGATSTFTLENNASNITLALGSGGNNDWIIGGTLGLTLTTPATAQTIAATLVGAGNFTLNNGSTGVTLSGGGGPMFSGTITIGNGVNATTVLLNSNNGLPILANVSLAAGTTTLNIIGYDTQIGSLTGGTTAILTNTGGAFKTLTVGNANTTTYSGVLTATTPANLGLTKIGSGKLTLNGPVVNPYTGATKVYAGELALDLTALSTPFQNLISSSSVWTLGGGTVSVKAHASSGAVAVQTLNGTTFAVGASAVSYNNNGASGTSLALAGLTRSAGSTVKFTLPGSGNITTTTTTTQNGVLVHGTSPTAIAYATIGTTDWANYSGGNIVAIGGYDLNDFTANTKNTDVTGSQSPTAFTVNTLRFNSDGAALALNSSGASTVNTGGILITGNANSSGVTISGSGSASLKPGGGKELVVINYGKLALNAVLADNAASAVTYSGTGTTDLTGNSAGNTYVGPTYLNQGTLKVSANNQLGAVGTGAAIHINGGTLQAGATFALDNSGATPKRGVTVYPAGATFDTGANTLTISGIILSGLANAGLITKTGSGTLVLSGVNTFFTGGFNWSAGNLSLGSTTALGASQPNFVTFASAGGLLDNTTGSALAAGNNPPMFWNADFAMVGNASATVTANDINMGVGAVLLGGNRTITVGQGSNYGTLTVGGVIHDGGMNYSLAKAGAGTLVLSGLSTYSGGTTLSAGTLAVGASSTGTLSADPSPGVVYGPVGTGTLTLNGGTLRTSSTTAYNIHNALAINGNVTLGDVANNGKLTFMGASQSIAAGSVVTALSAVTFGAGLTIGDGVKFYGPGLVTLQAQTVNNSSSNPIDIGDGTTFSGNGVGGNATVASQNSLGTAAITINYGGTLAISAAFNPSNAITVNNGGTLSITATTGTVTPGNTITLNNGATLSAAAALTLAGNVAFPTAGVLIINLTSGTISTANAYPTPTGTLVFGGRGHDANSAVLSIANPTTVSSNTTLAFNHLESGGLFLNGLALNADLTVAGVGLDIPYGSVPESPSTAYTHLGNITTVSGSRNIIIAMSPLGLVSATGSANWNNTTINSGTFEVSTSGNNIGSGTVTLNGGTLRLRNGNSSTKAITVAANGGVLDGVNFSAAPGSYSGAVTGASLAPLVIRSGTYATATSNFDLSSANLTGFNGAVILATAYYASPITLGANAVPSGGNTITVPKGIAFGGAAVKSGGLYSNNAKFITDYDSIYVVTASDTAPNLSNAGFARDIAVGLNGTALTGYTFPSAGPNTATYRIVLIGATTISAASTFTSGNNLDLSAAANVTDNNSGLYSMYTRTGNGGSSGLTLTAAQDYSGSTKITGGLLSPILRAGATGNTSARLIVGTGGSLTQTSSITIDNNGGNFAAYLELTGTAASPGRLTKANLPITIKGNGYLSIGGGEDGTRADNNSVTDRIHNTSDITLGGATGGGNLLLRYPLAGTHSQTLDALTIAAGMSSIQGGGPQPGANAQTASGTANLIFTGGGSYTRNTAGMLDITINANSTFSFTGAPSSGTAQGGAGDPILIGVTLNGADFVKAAAGAVVAPAYSVNNTPGSWTDNNIQTTGAFIAGNINDMTVNSLRIAAGSSGTVTINNGQTLTLGSGMISSHVAWTMTGGSLTTSSGRDLILHTSVNGITATINSTITGNNRLIKSGKGIVTLGTSSGSNAIGDIYLFFTGDSNQAGTLTANLQGSLGQSGTPRTIYFQGGTLSFANSVTQSYTDKSLNVGPSGGTWTDGGTAASSSFGGSVTMNGTLGITGTGVKILTGSISGAGMIDLAPTGSGRLTLSGDNSGWTGGMNIRNGAQVRLDNANAAGTGPIVNGNDTYWGAALIDFTPTFGTTFTNYLIGQGRVVIGGGNFQPNGGFVISNAKTAAPVTLSGNLTTSGGLTFQGVDLGGVNVSETVLANSVAVSGSQAFNYNYAGPVSGNATSSQLFVNGQGGINLGVTAFTGATQYQLTPMTRLAYGTAGFLAYNAGTTTPVENGAEGYVRFAPDANGYLKSFIPGAVGPGYVAALRKGGATALNFGYFLTGAKTGSGLTGTTTSGSILVTGLSSTAGYAVGQTITGTGIPGGTTIARIQSATSLALSANATATGSPTDIAISGSGTAYQLPEGKSFLIGTLGIGGGQTGTLGSAGTGSNTAILLGNPKAAAGQLLAGIGGGDINIHANAAADTAALNLSARNATDTLVLGDGVTAANNVVVTPTWGDSGAQSCITLMQKRTGATTLNKTGAGTVEIKGANFTHTDGADARTNMAWSVASGTLYYNQNDASANGFAGVTLTAGTLKFKVDSATSTKMNVKAGGTVALGSGVATLEIAAGAAPTASEYVLIDVGAGGTVTGSFADSKVTVGSKSYRVVTNGGDGNDVALNQIVSGTLILLR